jgi:hypothetical protein
LTTRRIAAAASWLSQRANEPPLGPRWAQASRSDGVKNSVAMKKGRRPIVGSAFFDAFDALTIAFVAPALIGEWYLKPI